VRSLVLTIDLDTPTEYAAIHGLQLNAEDPHAVYRKPLERFEGLCQQLGAAGTIFPITRDVCGIAAERLGQLSEQGFEIASHSHNHNYRLASLGPGDILRDLRASKLTLREQLDLNPMGFRAPGYQLSSGLLDELEGQGFAYDSSVLPSPLYYTAKLLTLIAYRMASIHSMSMLGPARQTMAPQKPYRPSRDPYRSDKGKPRKLVELPISVATPARLPLTGQVLTVIGDTLRNVAAKSVERNDSVVINFHGIDFADAQELPRKIVNKQKELGIPSSERVKAFEKFCKTIAQGRTVMTCAELAQKSGV